MSLEDTEGVAVFIVATEAPKGLLEAGDGGAADVVDVDAEDPAAVDEVWISSAQLELEPRANDRASRAVNDRAN